MGETESLLACPSRKEREKLLADLFLRHRESLRLMVKLRLDPRLHGRLDPSDVLQDVFVEVFRRLDEFLEARPMTVFLWLRRLILENRGGGTFSPPVHAPVAGGPSALAADWDGDVDLDLFVTSFEAHGVSLLVNDGKARFAAGPRIPVSPW
jgi:hypothetical protein